MYKHKGNEAYKNILRKEVVMTFEEIRVNESKCGQARNEPDVIILDNVPYFHQRERLD